MSCGPVKYPNILRQAAGFIGATIEHAADGFTDVSDNEFNRRITICSSCPLFNKEQETCDLCGCYMQTKARWRSGTCPDNPPRW